MRYRGIFGYNSRIKCNFDHFAISISLISTIGPYLAFGLRFEHIVIYPIAIFLLLTRGKRIYSNPFSLGILAVLAFSLIWSMIVTRNFSNINIIFANIDNTLIAILVIITASVVNINKRSIHSAMKTIIFIYAMASILQVIDKNNPIFSLFIGPSAHDLQSVWWLSSTNGRYIGFFFQPVEVGVAASCFIVYLLFSIRNRLSSSVTHLLLLLCVVLCGVLSVSKVFIYSSIAIAAFAFIFMLNVKNRLAAVFSLGIVALVLWRISDYWDGLSYFMRLFKAKDILSLELLTAGRYVGSSDLQINVNKVIYQHPLDGYGLSSNEVSDSFVLYALSQGGIPLLIMHSILMVFIFLCIMLNKTRRIPTSLILMIFITIAGSLGSPLFFLNKASIIYWILLIFIFRIEILEGHVRRKGESFYANKRIGNFNEAPRFNNNSY